MDKGTKTRVVKIPNCQLCESANKDETVSAYADAKIPLYGSWAYVCKQHFDLMGCELGLGKGQELILGMNE